jgi:hypothetical protein
MTPLDRSIDELELRRATARARRLADAAVGGPGGGAYVDAAERAAFLTRFPFETFAADLQRRLARATAAERRDGEHDDGRDPRGWLGRLRAAFGAAVSDRRVATALAAAGVVLVAGVLWFAGPFGKDGGPGSGDGAGVERGEGGAGGGFAVRPKGPAVEARKPGSPAAADTPVGLSFWVRSGDGARPGTPEGAYREGDQLRFTYWSGENDYLMLLSMEEDGAVSVYYPDEAAMGSRAQSVSIARGRNVELEGSIVLNEYVGQERFFALFSTRPLVVDEVRAVAAEAVRGLQGEGRDIRALERLPLDVPQASFWIRKVEKAEGSSSPSGVGPR